MTVRWQTSLSPAVYSSHSSQTVSYVYFKFKCSECDKSLKVRESLGGQKRVCPYCKKSLRIPMPSSLNLDVADVVEEAPAVPNINVQTGASAAAPPAKKPAAKPITITEPGSGKKATDPTDVSLLVSSGIAIVLTIVWLAAMFPIRHIKFGELFLDRGWVPFVLVFLMSWSGAIIILKALKLRRQRSYMLMDLLPTELSREITVDSLDKFVAHIHSLPGEPGESFLINRVLRGLEHFRVRKSTSETVTMMASQSEIDANNVMSSYTAIKVFIWAIPIMGFIGTVIGISAAVGGFSGNLDSSGDINALKDSLNGVTGGLATAFDTTLVALVMSLMVKFPTSAMQKSEEGVLSWVDEYCNENLSRRLNDGLEGGAERGVGSPGGAAFDDKAMRRALDAALATHRAELESWTERMKKVGVTVSDQVAIGWEEISEKQHEQYQQLLADFQESQQKLATELQQTAASGLTELQQQQVAHSNGFQESQSSHVAQLQAQLEEMSTLSQNIQGILAGLSEQSTTVQNQMLESVNSSNSTMETHFAGIEKGVTSLASVLERLGEQQVVVQQVEAPKRGWFGRNNSRPR